MPASAVLGDNNLQASVWVVDSDSMAVTRRQVTVGAMRGNSVEITSGLQGGERVVTAGAGYLIEGMKVRLMPDVEQADPATSPVANPS